MEDETSLPTRYEVLLQKLYQIPLYRISHDGYDLENMKSLMRHLGLSDVMIPSKCSNVADSVQLTRDDVDPLNNPLNDPLVVHVAGSNGKGSVCQKVAYSLASSNTFKKGVGLFTSPHISCFRERIQVISQCNVVGDESMYLQSETISEEDVHLILQLIFDICETAKIEVVFFEVVTALMFKYFYDHRVVDAIVIEVGLGGRLDATNVIANPTVSIITSIGLEHTKILGNNINSIAKEKGGIIKKGVPVVVGYNVPHEVIEDIAGQMDAPYFRDIDILGKGEEYSGEIDKDYNKQNERLAKAALFLLTKQMNLNIRDINLHLGLNRLPKCRFEEISIGTTKVIFDVAHNPSAIAQLAIKLKKCYPCKNFRVIVGFSGDKDIANCTRILVESVAPPQRIHLVESSTSSRAAKIEQILDACSMLNCSDFLYTKRSVESQTKVALKLALEHDEVLVVCGSFFIMSEARKASGLREARDSEFVTSAI